jgi:molybdopterin-guanine dinucleotide biosynthesis protein A
MNVTRIQGLVLAGGRSSRMKRDKAALEFREGETQLDTAMKLLEGRVSRAFVSVRADQRQDPARARYPHIIDRGDIEGPIAGISAAFSVYPDYAWLVLACDLPFLDAATLDTLLLARDPNFDATAYRSSHDGLPEPLCAIYEPSAREALLAQIAAGRNCPRKFLINAHTQLLDQPNPRALDNVNTVEEYERAMSTLDPKGATP